MNKRKFQPIIPGPPRKLKAPEDRKRFDAYDHTIVDLWKKMVRDEFFK